MQQGEAKTFRGQRNGQDEFVRGLRLSFVEAQSASEQEHFSTIEHGSEEYQGRGHLMVLLFHPHAGLIKMPETGNKVIWHLTAM